MADIMIDGVVRAETKTEEKARLKMFDGITPDVFPTDPTPAQIKAQLSSLGLTDDQANAFLNAASNL